MAKELLSDQRGLAQATLKARVCGVPELSLVFDPLGISGDDLAAIKALLGVQPVVALHAVRVPLTCYVQEPAQIQVTLVTTEVLAVPVTVLGLSELSAEDQLKQDGNDRVTLCSVS